jgi:hypothetical protein
MKIDQNGKKYSPKCNKTYLETRRKWYGKECGR